MKTQAELQRLPRVRTNSPYSLSVEELAARQIGLNNRGNPQSAVLYARKSQLEQKDMARSKIVSLFKREAWEGSLSILTMPGLHWTFERRLLAVREGNWQNRTQPARSTHITAVELDPAIYTAAMLDMPRKADSPIATYTNSPLWCTHSTGTNAVRRFYCCDVFNLMRENEKRFGAAWLDFLGPISADKLELIAAFYENWIDRTLILTFLRARQDANATLAAEEHEDLEQWLRRMLPGECLHVVRYQDGHSPMIQYAVNKI